MNISVVIPFFQRKPGLLARAIDSVLSSCSGLSIEIIVVDDGSPVTGESELGLVSHPRKDAVRLIRQTNGGVAKARNTGLAAVSPETTILTFLDADDAWLPNRIAHLQSAFDQGADCFFSDYLRQGETVSRFTWAKMNDARYIKLADCQDLSWFQGDMLGFLAEGRCPVGTSTLALRWTLELAALRFDEGFHRCAEDHYFYAQCFTALGADAKIAMSSVPDVDYDVGVGLETSAVWGSLPGLQRVVDSIRFHSLLERNFELSDSALRANDRSLQSIDREYFENLIAFSIKSRSLPIDLLREYFGYRPMLQWAPVRALKHLASSRLAARQ